MQPTVPIVLIGMMGAGKSTLGRVLSANLDRPFYDLDQRIEAVTGRSIAALFESPGEAAFRRMEQAELGALLAEPAAIVAAGGGVVEASPTRPAALCGRACVVWLRAPIDLLATRVGVGDSRPLLSGLDAVARRKRLALIEEARVEAYASWADFIFDAMVGETALESAVRLADELVERGYCPARQEA